jgi:hypothetical protein
LLGWLKINISGLGCASAATLLLGSLFQNAMLGFVRGWGARLWNSLVTVLFFAASLFVIAPLISIFLGGFYSLGLLSAFEREVTPLWYPASLVLIELFFLLLTMIAGSSLATQIYGIAPNRRGILEFWKHNWKKVAPEQIKSWRAVLGENKRMLFWSTLVACLLIAVGAWFELLFWNRKSFRHCSNDQKDVEPTSRLENTVFRFLDDRT